MPRVLIGLVVAVVVVAVGAIVVLAMRDGEPSSPAAPSSSVQSAAPVSQDDGAAESPSPVAEAAAQTRPVEPAKPAAVAPTAPNPEAAPATEVAAVDAKVARVLDSLSDEEVQALTRELGRRQMRKWQDQVKYQLPSSMKLYGLQWHNRGAYKIDEAQRVRITQIEESLKPRLDASLQTYWDQETALREQMMTAQSSGRSDDLRPLYEQMQQVQQQISTVKTDLDKEYRELLRGVLTPEQMEYLESNQGLVIQSYNGGSGAWRSK